jgi:hypothetical protein
MSEASVRLAVAQAPLSVVLHARALSTETQNALRSWRHYLDSLRRPHEILLLQETRPETGSAGNVVDSVQPTRTLSYERGLGLREALNEAIRSAQYPLVVFCSCDQQFQPMDLERLLRVIDQVDLVVGYRVGRPVPFWRVLFDTVIVLLSRIVVGIPLKSTECWLGTEGWGRRWMARWIFGLRVNDPECPFRLARREIVQRIPMQSKGSFAQIEMLAKANHLNCLIAEEPVTWTPPPAPATEATAFAEDAWRVFRDPDFGARCATA